MYLFLFNKLISLDMLVGPTTLLINHFTYIYICMPINALVAQSMEYILLKKEIICCSHVCYEYITMGNVSMRRIFIAQWNY